MSILSKMMRIAGRDTSGKARAIKTSEDGTLQTQLTGTARDIFVHHDNAITTGNGLYAVIDGKYATAKIEITGTFQGLLFARSRQFSGGSLVTIPVFDGIGRTIENITEPGIYYAQIDGAHEFMVRVNELSSGSVSVKSTMLPLKTFGNFNITSLSKRNIELKKVTNVSTPSNSVSGIASVDLADYVFVYVAVRRLSGTGVYDVELQFRSGLPVYSFGERVPIIIDGGLKKISEWQEVRGAGGSVHINNKSESDMTFDVWVYGVR